MHTQSFLGYAFFISYFRYINKYFTRNYHTFRRK
jgi:hypothetical protein